MCQVEGRLNSFCSFCFTTDFLREKEGKRQTKKCKCATRLMVSGPRRQLILIKLPAGVIIVIVCSWIAEEWKKVLNKLANCTPPECQIKQNSTHSVSVCIQLGNVASISRRCESGVLREIKRVKGALCFLSCH